jgi:F0F1-type ATP synthase alpha subunit
MLLSILAFSQGCGYVAQNDSTIDTQFKLLDSLSNLKKDSWTHWWSNELSIDFSSMGQVITVADNVVTVRGLSDVMLGEVVYVLYSYINAEKNVAVGEIVGQALNLNNDGTTGVVLFGDETMILAGNMVFGSGRLLSVPVGASTLGLVVNALGEVELSGHNKSSICLAPGNFD